MRDISLVAILFLCWLVLSGHYTPFLIVCGFAAAVACLWAAKTMRSVDEEGHPIVWLKGAIFYQPWLLLEIVKSAINVSKIIWHPRLPISPTMTVVPASQKTTVGIATYANSITLTPGTVTAAVHGDHLTVHALEAAGADDLEAGEMNERVVAYEKGK